MNTNRNNNYLNKVRENHNITKLEERCAGILYRVCRNKRWRYKTCLGNMSDYRQGTDFRINNIRIDVTGLEKDDNCIKGYKHIELYNCKGIVCFVKRSNTHVAFKTPVLMIQARCSDYRIYDFFNGEEFVNVLESFCKKVAELGYEPEQGFISYDQLQAQKKGFKVTPKKLNGFEDMMSFFK